MYYFASDMHLGLPPAAETAGRERLLIRWLRDAAPAAQATIPVGDVSDLRYEYRPVVPTGFRRLPGPLA